MISTVELLRQGRRDEIWTKYCGFIDLSMREFMAIQERLLLEQIDLLYNCELGRRSLGGRKPTSIDEFRQDAPLTTYADYMSEFAEQREDHLPAKPRWWLRTSGRTGGPGNHKWAPYTPEMARRLGQSILTNTILAACNGRGEFPFVENDRLLFTLAPFPYLSGGGVRALLEEFPFTFLPSVEEAEKMDYESRMAEGLRLGLRDGIDHFFALSVVLVRIAEQFSQQSGNAKLSQYLVSPSTLLRLARGMIRARAQGRKHLLPKDIWNIKGLASGGTDTEMFSAKIREAWGRDPIEAYGFTEGGGMISTQLWRGPGMVFQPDISLLEFIPLEEFDKNVTDPNYRPRTMLLDEVEKDGVYELVVTNFHGGAFTRYRVGDLIRIIALNDPAVGVALPKMVFHSKAHDLIDLAALVRINENMIWRVVHDSGVPYVDWTARKEYHDGQVYLAVYIEPKSEGVDVAQVHQRMRQLLREIDPEYADAETILKMDPLRVTLLPSGAFKHFLETRKNAGADLAYLKPSHMQISDGDLSLLMGAKIAEV